MIKIPKTPEEAAAYRYGTWAGAPKGRAYQPSQCAYEVAQPHSFLFTQCAKNKGHGPHGLFCKQHARKAEARL